MSESDLNTKHCRALVVDDDPVLRIMAVEALSTIGLEVEEADDGEEALESIQASPPDLILLDVGLPGMDGFETCQALRKLEVSAQTPVLMMTGTSNADSVDAAFLAGATDFVSKPLDWQLLQHRVRFLMRAHDAFEVLQSTLGDLQESERRLANAQRIARLGSWEWVPGQREMLWSEQVYEIFERRREPMSREVRPTFDAFLERVHRDDREDVKTALQEAAEQKEYIEVEHRIEVGECSENSKGNDFHVRQQIEVFLDEEGNVARFAGSIQDITERKRAEDQIRYLAYYDSLTALPNRRMLSEHLTRVLSRVKDSDEKVALLFVDLDRFKRVNDTLGHAVGDTLLRLTADRLMACVRTTDYVGRPRPRNAAVVSRLGGDEFTIVLRTLNSASDAAMVAQRILDMLREPFEVEGHSLEVSASVGIALCPEDGEDADSLLRSSDAAMYHAKQEGRNRFQFFSEVMNRKAMRNLSIESGLRRAIEREEFSLVYQPQLDLETGRLGTVEALLRWESAELGNVPPGEFIPIAEESGLASEIGEWVLRCACAQAQVWSDAGLEIRMGVNVSSRQVHRGDLVDVVGAVIEETGIDPRMLELEITESSILTVENDVVETLKGVRALGVSLALDDFGTGYSSLSHLLRFPIQTLKIDRSFISDLGNDGTGQDLVAGVVAMALRLGLRVTAEGVETQEQFDFLRAEGCHKIQGFMISHPVDPETLESKLRESSEG